LRVPQAIISGYAIRVQAGTLSETTRQGTVISDGVNDGVIEGGDGAALVERSVSCPSLPVVSERAPVDTAEGWASWGRSAPLAEQGIGTTAENVLASQPLALLWFEALLLAASVSIIDFVTPFDLNFSIFYLFPVIFATWFISRKAGLFIAVASVVSWVSLDIVAGVHFSSPLVPFWNAGVRSAFFFIVLILVSVMKESKVREAALARTDSLTGVANGRSFADRASLELASMRRTGRPITVAYLDLDHFKAVNDARGHSEGDRLLLVVAKAICARVRMTDLVARLGGDEFGILLPGTDRFAAPRVLEAIESAVREALDGGWEVGCTIGAVTFEQTPESVDFMVRASDQLMYEGKKRGRGRIEHAVWPIEEPEEV
jgi:diguanylate cyclase (GGDEF)-like protein